MSDVDDLCDVEYSAEDAVPARMSEGGRAQIRFAENIDWEEKYQRNNKSTKQKNLRCFPMCSRSKHQEGFCGRSILACVDNLDPAIPVASLHTVGKLAIAKLEPLAPGAVLTMEELIDHGAETKNAGEGSFPGTQIDQDGQPVESLMGKAHSGIVRYEFNRTLKGWHYGFLGSKKTRNTQHAFVAYALARLPDKNAAGEVLYEVLGWCTSPSWCMYCRRRKHTMMIREHQKMQLLHEKEQSSGNAQVPDVVSHFIKVEAPGVCPQVVRPILGSRAALGEHRPSEVGKKFRPNRILSSGNLPHPESLPVVNYAEVGESAALASAASGGLKRNRSQLGGAFPGAEPFSGRHMSQRRKSEDCIADFSNMSFHSKAQHAAYSTRRQHIYSAEVLPTFVKDEATTAAQQGLARHRPVALELGAPFAQENPAVVDDRWALISGALAYVDLPRPLCRKALKLLEGTNFQAFAENVRALLRRLDQMRNHWDTPVIPHHVEAFSTSTASLNDADHLTLHILTTATFKARVHEFVLEEMDLANASQEAIAAFGLRLLSDMLDEFLSRGQGSWEQRCTSSKKPAGLEINLSTINEDYSRTFSLASPNNNNNRPGWSTGAEVPISPQAFDKFSPTGKELANFFLDDLKDLVTPKGGASGAWNEPDTPRLMQHVDQIIQDLLICGDMRTD